MCGRYTLRSTPEQIQEEFGFAPPTGFTVRYNVAPTQDVLTMVESESGRPEMTWLRWGLVPFWAKDPAIGNRMINARAETIAEKPAYREAFKRRRCLVIADGFFEWQRQGKGPKQPMWVRRRDDRPFAFAGVWERWGPKEEPLRSCTIITTEPNELMRAIHNRMPVILDRDARERWLDPDADPDSLASLLAPCAEAEWRADAVSRAVNNAGHDGPDCVELVGASAPDGAE